MAHLANNLFLNIFLLRILNDFFYFQETDKYICRFLGNKTNGFVSEGKNICHYLFECFSLNAVLFDLVIN